ncbi:hypothetical protein LY78DRAFT_662206 [Colletotrichum sublineola]|nr:hypothetical protein LY78DRAFT_662206 [Colletotrichum sublineola]
MGAAQVVVLLLPPLLLSPEVLCRRGCWLNRNDSEATLPKQKNCQQRRCRKRRGFCSIVRRLCSIVRGKVSRSFGRWHVSMQRWQQVGVREE